MSVSSDLIRDLRRESGLTQAELAQRMGVSQSAVAKLEREDSNPSVATLQRAVAATGHRLQLIAPAFGDGVDVGLIRTNLAQTPAERIASLDQLNAGVRRLQRNANRPDGRAA